MELKDSIKELRKQEIRLKRRFGIRVHVDKLAADRTHVLCTAWRTGSFLLQSPMDEHEIVDLVHGALRSFHLLGLRPLVGVVQKRNLAAVPPIVKTDPFHLVAALNFAEETRNGTAGIAREETDRRAQLLVGDHVLR